MGGRCGGFGFRVAVSGPLKGFGCRAEGTVSCFGGRF